MDLVDWGVEAVDWFVYDRVVLRSTWDYSQRLEDFLARLSVVESSTDLRNPAGMVRWGLDKRYLADLAAEVCR